MRLLEDDGVGSDSGGAESWALTWHRHGLVSRAREEKKKKKDRTKGERRQDRRRPHVSVVVCLRL